MKSTVHSRSWTKKCLVFQPPLFFFLLWPAFCSLSHGDKIPIRIVFRTPADIVYSSAFLAEEHAVLGRPDHSYSVFKRVKCSAHYVSICSSSSHRLWWSSFIPTEYMYEFTFICLSFLFLLLAFFFVAAALWFFFFFFHWLEPLKCFDDLTSPFQRGTSNQLKSIVYYNPQLRTEAVQPKLRHSKLSSESIELNIEYSGLCGGLCVSPSIGLMSKL